MEAQYRRQNRRGDAPSEKLIDFVLVIMTKNTERVTDVIR